MNETRRPSFDLIGTSSAQNVGSGSGLPSISDPPDSSATLPPYLQEAFDTARRTSIEAEAWNEPCSRVPLWAIYLEKRPGKRLSRTQQIILGRVLKIQTSGKDDRERGYRISLNAAAKEFGIEHSTFRRAIRELVKAGHLKKQQEGKQSIPSYTVDVLKCYKEAIANGFTPRSGSDIDFSDPESIVQAAMSERYCRVPLWAIYLDITPREQVVFGRIMGFQVRHGDRPSAEYRLSLASAAREFGFKSLGDLWGVIHSLVKKGIVEALTNGKNKPTTYRVKVAEAYEAALANGYEPVNRKNDKTAGKHSR